MVDVSLGEMMGELRSICRSVSHTTCDSVEEVDKCNRHDVLPRHFSGRLCFIRSLQYLLLCAHQSFVLGFLVVFTQQPASYLYRVLVIYRLFKIGFTI